jgi:hypothetical protein
VLKAYESEKVEPTTAEVRMLRKEMVPKISPISRELASRRKGRSYLDGTLCNPSNVKGAAKEFDLDKENVPVADAENPEATFEGDPAGLLEPKSETKPDKPKKVRRKKPKAQTNTKAVENESPAVTVGKYDSLPALLNFTDPASIPRKPKQIRPKRKSKYVKGFDMNPDYNYDRALNIRPEDNPDLKYNPNYIQDTFCRCHGYASYEPRVNTSDYETVQYLVYDPPEQSSPEPLKELSSHDDYCLTTEDTQEEADHGPTVWHHMGNADKIERDYAQKFSARKKTGNINQQDHVSHHQQSFVDHGNGLDTKDGESFIKNHNLSPRGKGLGLGGGRAWGDPWDEREEGMEESLVRSRVESYTGGSTTNL